MIDFECTRRSDEPFERAFYFRDGEFAQLPTEGAGVLALESVVRFGRGRGRVRFARWPARSSCCPVFASSSSRRISTRFALSPAATLVEYDTPVLHFEFAVT
jgi:hypothetical protein